MSNRRKEAACWADHDGRLTFVFVREVQQAVEIIQHPTAQDAAEHARRINAALDWRWTDGHGGVP